MHSSPIIMLGGLHIDLSVVLMLVVTSVIVFVLAKLATRNLSVENPGKLQNFMEWGVDFIKNMVSSTMDMKKGKHFVSLGLALILFIFVGNLLGLPFGIVTDYHDKSKAQIFGHELYTVTTALDKANEQHPDEHAEVGVAWWKSPTADAGVSMGLAAMIFLLSHFLGMTKNTKGYFRHYIEPYVFFLPINLIEQVSKLLTHGMRLFGNIFAGEVLISVILKLTALGVGGYVASVAGLIVWQGFSLFVGTIQAFIFVMLTMVYLSQMLESHDDHEHEH
ncbi:F0F1 ATP synthase subunit A [Paenibacillus pini]|uniref:ATP synthase subunit a n=1 Tax=Paenibacillus pini JCM 16418 TaxID=1236976 RepID=W7YH13_9BACL|nr:F0F1 ATP synthase subunit A [Paenibacillus pini]GAF10200.1 ATP synthase A chain [Paenibacillus pini JCM 16418]